MELNKLFGLLDITSLDPLDDENRIKALVRKVRIVFEQTEGEYAPAAICVFPNWVPLVKEQLYSLPIQVAAVTGGFPHGQTFTQVKMMETHTAVEKGADEIDMVINRGLLLSGRIEECGMEIKALRELTREKVLKVIIESGELKDTPHITGAAVLALHLGADFVKTSTGKSAVGATPDAAIAICSALADFYTERKIKKGIKISGGVATVEQAAEYVKIVNTHLDASWLHPTLFRIGASRLANDILVKLGREDLAIF